MATPILVEKERQRRGRCEGYIEMETERDGRCKIDGWVDGWMDE